jgi:hypothetical protein
MIQEKVDKNFSVFTTERSTSGKKVSGKNFPLLFAELDPQPFHLPQRSHLAKLTPSKKRAFSTVTFLSLDNISKTFP